MLSRTVVTTTLLLATLPVDAALYRWVDERGVVQFSDQPPPRHASGDTISLDVVKPASGTTPLTDSIPQRSHSLSNSRSKYARSKARKGSRANTARRGSTLPKASRARSPSPRIRVSGY